MFVHLLAHINPYTAIHRQYIKTHLYGRQVYIYLKNYQFHHKFYFQLIPNTRVSLFSRSRVQEV